MFVKRSFSSDRNGDSTTAFPPLCQLLTQHKAPHLRLRAAPRTSPRRCSSSSRPMHHAAESADLQRSRAAPAYTTVECLLSLDTPVKKCGHAPRSLSVVRRRPEQGENREKATGGVTPLRCAVAKPLDITTSVRRVLDLIKGPSSENREKSPLRFRKSHIRRPMQSPDSSKLRYHPARFVAPNTVPQTSRPPDAQAIFQPSACKFHTVDLRVLQENSAGKLQREMELRRLEDAMFADSRGNSILRKQQGKEGSENEQPKSVTFADVPESSSKING